MPAVTLRRAGRWLGLVLALVLAWTGIRSGVLQWPQSRTAGEMVQTATQLAYGVLGALTVVTAFRVRRWSRPVRAAWIASVAVAGGLGAVVWGDAGVWVGVGAGAASLVVTWGMVRLIALEDPPSPRA